MAFTVEPSGRITATVLPVTRKQLQSQVTALLATSNNATDAQKAKTLLLALGNELIPQALRTYLPKNPEQTVAIIPDGIPLQSTVRRTDRPKRQIPRRGAYFDARIDNRRISRQPT